MIEPLGNSQVRGRFFTHRRLGSVKGTHMQSLSTSQMLARIRARHADSGFAVLTEVGDATGVKHTRWADALVMNLWPSRGLELHGYEVKVSRSDWLKELREPSKAEAIARYCDRWWIAVGDASIAKTDELPRGWGLLVPKADGLRVAKQASLLKPKPVTREFLAAIFRRCTEQSADVEREQKIRNDGWEQGTRDAKRDVARELSNYADLKRAISKFEEVSGVKIRDTWRIESIGKAVETVLNGEHKPHIWHLAQLSDAMNRIQKILEPFIPEIEALRK